MYFWFISFFVFLQLSKETNETELFKRKRQFSESNNFYMNYKMQDVNFKHKINRYKLASHRILNENSSGKILFSNSGYCGENVSYIFDENSKTLNIFGNGSMYDYKSNNKPWESILEMIEIVNISYGVTYIGKHAFYKCTNLKNVYISNTMNILGLDSFSYCTSINSINIPDSVYRISGCFRFCINLSFVNLGKGLSIINWDCFAYCNNIKSFNVSTLNENLQSIDGIIFSKDNKTLIAYPSGSNISSYHIPSGTTDISSYAFGECSNLKTLTIPNSITEIDTTSLGNLISLQSFNVDQSHPTYFTHDGVLFTKEKPATLFRYPAAKSDKSYTIPSTVKYLKMYSFSCNNYIECISIGRQFDFLHFYSFSRCNNLNSLVYHGLEQPKSSGTGNPFFSCSHLKKVQVHTDYSNSTFFNLPIEKVENPKCETSDDNTPTEYIQTTDNITPTDDIQTTDNITPTEYIQTTEVITPTDDIKPTDNITPTEYIQTTAVITPTDNITPTEDIKPTEVITATEDIIQSDDDISPSDDINPDDNNKNDKIEINKIAFLISVSFLGVAILAIPVAVTLILYAKEQACFKANTNGQLNEHLISSISNN